MQLRRLMHELQHGGIHGSGWWVQPGTGGSGGEREGHCKPCTVPGPSLAGGSGRRRAQLVVLAAAMA